MSKPYVIRVSVAHNGYSSHRTYSRGAMPLSRQAFNEYAVGNMLTLLITGYTNSLEFSGGINGNRIDMSGFSLEGYAVDIIDEVWTEEDSDIRFRAAHGM